MRLSSAERPRRLTNANLDSPVTQEPAERHLEWAPLEERSTYYKITVVDEIDMVLALCGASRERAAQRRRPDPRAQAATPTWSRTTS